MQSAHIRGQISYAVSLINTHANMALKTFNQCIIEAAHCMETFFFLFLTWEREKNATNWFDYECIIARRNVRKVLGKFRKSLSTNDRES